MKNVTDSIKDRRFIYMDSSSRFIDYISMSIEIFERCKDLKSYQLQAEKLDRLFFVDLLKKKWFI
jgi:hypothetical protein